MELFIIQKDYWLTIEPTRENVNLPNYINLMKYKFDKQFLKKCKNMQEITI